MNRDDSRHPFLSALGATSRDQPATAGPMNDPEVMCVLVSLHAAIELDNELLLGNRWDVVPTRPLQNGAVEVGLVH
mgnify:CR=1 FL=1